MVVIEAGELPTRGGDMPEPDTGHANGAELLAAAGEVKRNGITLGELHDLARALMQGKTWEQATAPLYDVYEDVLTAWRPEVERLAAMADPPMWSDLDAA